MRKPKERQPVNNEEMHGRKRQDRESGVVSFSSILVQQSTVAGFKRRLNSWPAPL
jgi:hypothetical protein